MTRISGPYGRAAIARLPNGSVRVRAHGRSYWRDGYRYYRPYYYGGTVYYYSTAPPVGVYYETLPESTVVVIDGRSYYYYDGAYLQRTEKDGSTAYVVVEDPKGSGGPEVTSSAGAPDPFETLRTMADYVGGLAEFTVVGGSTFDEILDSGEKIQRSEHRTITVKRPNRAAVDYRGDDGVRRVVYDGKTVTVVDKAKSVYGVIKAPNTMAEAVDMMAKDYGMTVPMSDVFLPDAYEGLIAQVRTGQYVGLHSVAMYQCHHLAFTEDGIDWEIWIQTGKKPVPRKLVITYKQLPGSPRHTAMIPRWDMSEIPNVMFSPRIPPGAEKVEMLPVSPTEE